MKCRHCKRARISRPRGLCWCCYYAPGVRELYAPVSKHGRRGVGNCYHDAPLPEFPTSALPGTPEKGAVLAERVRLRQSLWHPEDAKLDAPAPPVAKAA